MMLPLIGIIFGLSYGGPVGAICGGLIGYFLQKKIFISLESQNNYSDNRYNIQSTFFKATFLSMGKIAKSDGRISKDEIQKASDIMSDMRLSDTKKKEAIYLFNLGKQPSTDINAILLELRQTIGSKKLILIFLEIQLQAAYADGILTNGETKIFHSICQTLGVSNFAFQLIHRRFQAQQHFYHQENYQSTNHSYDSDLREAYEILGVKPTSTNSEIKRAYLKLMSQHHPDKLVTQGLPKEMIDVAKKKTQQIQLAYNQIQKYRK